ncbi:hypothetical protein M595_5504 [Lyngbya aestuarii BL J]|uniref:Uncharacterized protein n=1 Tax=Lyngbya aestuarii BL J TaxID=1348334 RepID=U7QBI3_9CYAN|nr:hypothetical protein M595_5504 [Lyngbya aestuarii BL J]
MESQGLNLGFFPLSPTLGDNGFHGEKYLAYESGCHKNLHLLNFSPPLRVS